MPTFNVAEVQFSEADESSVHAGSNSSIRNSRSSNISSSTSSSSDCQCDIVAAQVLSSDCSDGSLDACEAEAEAAAVAAAALVMTSAADVHASVSPFKVSASSP
jgi:hypothetical protein